MGAVFAAPVAAQAAPYDISPQRVAGAYASDGLHVFARNPNGYLDQKIISPNGHQSGWVQMGTTVASSPAATVDENGRIYVAARASNGNVLYRWREAAGTWTGWHNIGGNTYGAPALQAIPAEAGPPAYVAVAAQTAAGTAQLRLFQPGSLSPRRYGIGSTWTEFDKQVLQSAPMLGVQVNCQAPDGFPTVAFVNGRSATGTGIHRAVCDQPGPKWQPTVGRTASSIAQDFQNGFWYRGTDGALWNNTTRVGVPATGLRVACTPTVSGARVRPWVVSSLDPDSVLVRDNLGHAWLYTPPGGFGNVTGGVWTSLGGSAV
ncbi:hypothetical protein GCM10009765_30550 [Fodinicola feengrottensis]|uniref:PLL-like beta propeller domain-containing protein n=1 Tax=Fodinicola feengrottensis TaxID=435914 RepID=A0ABN2GYZ0_9ACTN